MESNNIYTVERKIGDPVIRFETGRFALLADGAVQAQAGDTTVLVTATAARHPREGTDFFPLTVDIEERKYAVGKIPGGFFRREGRAGEKAILTMRLIDRPLRPCFPDGFRNDIHIVGLVQAVDGENLYDVLAINAASAALLLSGIPFDGPVGAVRLAHLDGRWITNPTYQQLDEATFEIVVAGRKNAKGGADIMMVEAGATEQAFDLVAEGAPEVTEAIVAQGLEEAKTPILEVIGLQEELLAAAGAKQQTCQWAIVTEPAQDAIDKVRELGQEKLRSALSVADKEERESAVDVVGDEITNSLAEEFAGREGEIKAAFRKLTKSLIRGRILDEGIRMDGRGLTDVRPVSCAVGVIPRVHGTGLFNRGQTQVLSFLTLGMLKMEQNLDDLGVVETKRYMHNYNMPPFATGEARFMRGPGRREIGHGALAERSLLPVIPTAEEFPYALRIVSEVLASNGSSSMASVCGSTLALMDCGVPIKAPVAGVAMGLISDGERFVTLTDILGAEDNFGDMDFKVAGTATMITGLQLDTKISGIPSEVLASALDQAFKARLFILGRMAEAIGSPRTDLNPNAPRVIAFKIPIDKIGEVIGPKGKRINEIIAVTGVQVDIEDDGTVRIGSTEEAPALEAQRMIQEVANPRIPEVGEKFNGRVVKIVDFGAFVNLAGATDGLVHISKLGGNIRLARVEDVLSEGDDLEVVVTEIDARGKISLDPVTLPPRVAELPADYAAKNPRPERPRRDFGGDRGRDRGGRDRDRRPPRRDRDDRPPRD